MLMSLTETSRSWASVGKAIYYILTRSQRLLNIYYVDFVTQVAANDTKGTIPYFCRFLKTLYVAREGMTPVILSRSLSDSFAT